MSDLDVTQYEHSDALDVRKELYRHCKSDGWRTFVVNETQGFDGMRLLDVGCGNARVSTEIAREYQDVDLVGVDRSEKMITEAEANANGLQARFILADAKQFELEGSFDRILVLHMLHLVSDPKAVLLHAYSLLKPGGRMIITVHSSEDMPKRNAWQAWMQTTTGSSYSAKRDQFTLEHHVTDLLSALPFPSESHHIRETIILTTPEPYLNYIESTRHRFVPTPTDEAWQDFRSYVRKEIETEIQQNGSFEEPSITGGIIVTKPL